MNTTSIVDLLGAMLMGGAGGYMVQAIFRSRRAASPAEEPTSAEGQVAAAFDGSDGGYRSPATPGNPSSGPEVDLADWQDDCPFCGNKNLYIHNVVCNQRSEERVQGCTIKGAHVHRFCEAHTYVQKGNLSTPLAACGADWISRPPWH